MKRIVRYMSLFAVVGSSMLWAQGTISGQVKMEGSGPRLRAIKMAADPVCSAAHTKPVYPQTVVVAEDGSLANVLISITAGLEGQTFTTPSDVVVLDQTGCVYEPHVWGVMAGQTLEIRNSDATLHNIHSQSKVNRSFNFAMPRVIKKKNQVFDKVEAPFKIKCDVHPWMATWGAVFDHPYFAVTDAAGGYSLENVPAGTYTVQAWHESSKRLPAQTQSVTVTDGAAANLDFTFTPVRRK